MGGAGEGRSGRGVRGPPSGAISWGRWEMQEAEPVQLLDPDQGREGAWVPGNSPAVMAADPEAPCQVPGLGSQALKVSRASGQEVRRHEACRRAGTAGASGQHRHRSVVPREHGLCLLPVRPAVIGGRAGSNDPASDRGAVPSPAPPRQPRPAPPAPLPPVAGLMFICCKLVSFTRGILFTFSFGASYAVASIIRGR